MKKPVLVIMAAGMGSRYGGMKQIDPIDRQGHIIMDFSIYDAKKAGFEEMVFIIKKETEQLFREAIGNRIEKSMKVHYVFQDLNDIPEGFEVPEGRVKPWGTAHAVLSARNVIEGPFVVINADDYYGSHAFSLIYDFLEKNVGEGSDGKYAMVGYLIKNTLTENGSVARGICSIEDGYLKTVVERTKIIQKGDGAAFTEDDVNWTEVPGDTVVSMNMWGFPGSFIEDLKELFPAFLKNNIEKNPQKCEYYIPFAVNEMMEKGRASVKVLTSPDVWHGVTYAEDKPDVVKAMQELKNQGLYPEEF